MTRDEALKLLRGGAKGVAEWNRRRGQGEKIPPLGGVSLDNAVLDDFDLSDIDLHSSSLRKVSFIEACLSNANLSDARLWNARFIMSDLKAARLCGADLSDAEVRDVGMAGADLAQACLHDAHFLQADIAGSSLRHADLTMTVIAICTLTGTECAYTRWGWTTLADVDLRGVRGLDTAQFSGPCSVGVDTLVRSRGRIPESFLHSCGFQPWQVIQAKTYDPALSRMEFTDLLYKVDIARNQGPLFVGGVFISYSHDDAKFVDKIRGRLTKEGAPVWLDRHDIVAGDMQKQVNRAIRLNDVVLLVLSESSVNSDWVEHELEMARKKEKDEGRDVLCPVALDDSWKDKMDDVLWRQIKKKNVLDFSKWKTKAFEPVYQKLTAGLKVNYGSAPGAPAADAT